MKQPMTAVLHEMIGTAVKCWEERHDVVVREMIERNRTLLRIVAAYYKKYGKVFNNDVKEVRKEEEAEDKGKPADKDAPPGQ